MQPINYHSFPDLPDLQNLKYSYDLVGNIQTILDQNNSGQKQCFTYDDLNRLTNATTTNDLINGCEGILGDGSYDEGYTYDEATGNLASKTGVGTYDYEDLNHVHAVTAIGIDPVLNYTYDTNGNMITRDTDAGSYDLSYDAENRLVHVKKDDVLIAEYKYDADGQRVLAKDYPEGQEEPDQTFYYGNYLEVFIDADYVAPEPEECPTCTYKIYMPFLSSQDLSPEPGQVWKSYYYSGSAQIAMWVLDNAGGESGVIYLYADHLGSISVAAGENGIETSKSYYKPWGEQRGSSEVSETTFGFTGQRKETGLNLYFYQSRWYDPSMMKWLTPDTVIPDPNNPLDYDRYAYVRNNPVNFNDPSGHAPCYESTAKCQDYWTAFYKYQIKSLKYSVKSEFGITVSDDYQEWRGNDLTTLISGLHQMNNVLKGNLGLITSGWTLRFSNSAYGYGGITAGAFIDFNADSKGIPLINIYHEFSHLINSGANKVWGIKLTSLLSQAAIYDTNNNFIWGRQGNNFIRNNVGINTDIWDSNRNSNVAAIQHPTTSVDDSFTVINEDLADNLANYFAGNIDLSNLAGQARAAWISKTIAPLIINLKNDK